MSEPVIPQCAACRVAGSYAHCDACPKTPWQEYASSEDGMREYAKAEPVMTDMRCGKCGYELPDQAPQIDYRPCGYCILLEQCEQQAATIERLTGIIQAARKHKLLILHDAECFSIDGSKPCVCGREELRAILDAGDMHASSAITMMAINERLTKALCMLYDKYEDGPPCTEDGDEFGSPLGNCVQLTADEEDEILALIPASRDAAFSKQEPK